MERDGNDPVYCWQGWQSLNHGFGEWCGQRKFSPVFEQSDGFFERSLVGKETPGLRQGQWSFAAGSALMSGAMQ